MEVNLLREQELIDLITPLYEPIGVIGYGLQTSRLLFDVFSQKPLNLLVPETLIYGYGFERPTLLYTDCKGLVQSKKIDENSYDSFIEILKSNQIINSSLISPLAVLKSSNSQFHKIFMRSNELKTE